MLSASLFFGREGHHLCAELALQAADELLVLLLCCSGCLQEICLSLVVLCDGLLQHFFCIIIESAVLLAFYSSASQVFPVFLRALLILFCQGQLLLLHRSHPYLVLCLYAGYELLEVAGLLLLVLPHQLLVQPRQVGYLFVELLNEEALVLVRGGDVLLFLNTLGHPEGLLERCNFLGQ